jgi:hypothetical protein
MFLNNSDDPRRPERAPSSQQCDVLFRSNSDSARFTVRFQRHVRHSHVVNSASRRRPRANALVPALLLLLHFCKLRNVIPSGSSGNVSRASPRKERGWGGGGGKSEFKKFALSDGEIHATRLAAAMAGRPRLSCRVNLSICRMTERSNTHYVRDAQCTDATRVARIYERGRTWPIADDRNRAAL